MNTSVNFEIAKLLKEKGFDVKTTGSYVDTTPFSENENDFVEYFFEQNHNEKEHRVSAPTIAEVVMWLYEKHDIYINVIPDLSSRHNLIDRKFYVSMFKYSMNINVQVEILKEDKNILYFNKLENAYEFGILHALKNLI